MLIESNAIHQFYLVLARRASQNSPDPSTKVGALLVEAFAENLVRLDELTLEQLVIRSAHNDFPTGVASTPERWNDRVNKYSFVLHAELRVFTSLLRNPPRRSVEMRSSTMYVYGLPPCGECAGVLVDAGVRRVVYADLGDEDTTGRFRRWQESTDSGKIKFQEAGVSVIGLKPLIVN